jgi:hypothetical protein
VAVISVALLGVCGAPLRINFPLSVGPRSIRAQAYLSVRVIGQDRQVIVRP